jgi:uncharacterized protein (TIGR03083 family)
MDPATHLGHLEADSAALLSAYRADPTAAVPSCPGWDRAELLAHVAGVHAWVRAQLAVGTDERVRLSTVERPPEGDALASWYERGAGELLDALRSMDVDATWPTWAGPQPGTFFARRMAVETAVHRWDADASPIDPALAVDGVDELLELFAPRLPAERFAADPGTIHLHATDTDGEWLVRFTPEGIRFEHGHAKGDVALRGSASDLLLWTWNRLEADDRLQTFGNEGLLATWRETVVF